MTRWRPLTLTFSSLLPAFSLSCLNDSLPTHYHCQTSSFSCIDVSLCSSFVLPLLSWQRLCSFHGSDHYPVLLAEVFHEAFSASPSPLPHYSQLLRSFSFILPLYFRAEISPTHPPLHVLQSLIFPSITRKERIKVSGTCWLVTWLGN